MIIYLIFSPRTYKDFYCPTPEWPPSLNLYILDEGPETGDESDEDIIRNYLPGEQHDIIRNYEPHHNIPAINITLHSNTTNHVLGKTLSLFLF